MKEAPKELWVVFDPRGNQFAADEFELIAVGRATIGFWQLKQFSKQIVDINWAKMQAEGWQCVKYVREE